MRREELIERIRVRLNALPELQKPEDLARAALLLDLAASETLDYASSARRYELVKLALEIESCARVLRATYLTIQLNGGGEEVLKRAKSDLEEGANALRKLLALI